MTQPLYCSVVTWEKYMSIKVSYMNVRIFICENQKLETTQMSINRQMTKHIVLYPYNGSLINNKKKEWTSDTCNESEEFQK